MDDMLNLVYLQSLVLIQLVSMVQSPVCHLAYCVCGPFFCPIFIPLYVAHFTVCLILSTVYGTVYACYMRQAQPTAWYHLLKLSRVLSTLRYPIQCLWSVLMCVDYFTIPCGGLARAVVRYKFAASSLEGYSE